MEKRHPKSKKDKKRTGNIGEQHASNYLQSNGYKVIETNYTPGRWGEIDIIAIKNNEIIFVEVKTRQTGQFGGPLEAISHQKIRILKRTAQRYLFTKGRQYTNFQINFLAVGIKINADNIEVSEAIID